MCMETLNICIIPEFSKLKKKVPFINVPAKCNISGLHFHS